MHDLHFLPLLLILASFPLRLELFLFLCHWQETRPKCPDPLHIPPMVGGADLPCLLHSLPPSLLRIFHPLQSGFRSNKLRGGYFLLTMRPPSLDIHPLGRHRVTRKRIRSGKGQRSGRRTQVHGCCRQEGHQTIRSAAQIYVQRRNLSWGVDRKSQLARAPWNVAWPW